MGRSSRLIRRIEQDQSWLASIPPLLRYCVGGVGVNVPIIVSEHPELRIHLLRLCDRVSFNEICNLNALHESRRDWAAADSVHIVEEGADVSELTEPRLDFLRQQYRTLHQGIEFYLVRRSVWICREPKAWSAVEYWLKDRHWRDGQGTDVFLCADVRDADEVLSAEEVQAIEAPCAFRELARLDDSAEAETSPQ